MTSSLPIQATTNNLIISPCWIYMCLVKTKRIFFIENVEQLVKTTKVIVGEMGQTIYNNQVGDHSSR